jgi:PAS domain S-box-containing protein
MDRRILIVEDDLVFRNYLYQVLKYDYSVTAVPGPLEALEALREGPFALMITDLRMPDMDGRALAEKVHREIDPDLMIIVVTAFEDDWPMDQAMSTHVFRYLRKGSFLPSELKQDVDKALEIRASMMSLGARGGGLADEAQGRDLGIDEYRRRLSKLTEQAKDLIVWLDGGCRCTYVNNEAARILRRYRDGDLVGEVLPWEDILHPDDRGVVERIRRLGREGAGLDEGEVRLTAGPGEVRHLNYRVFFDRAPDGTLSSIDIVAEDLTPQRTAEQELKNANRKLQEFNERLSGGVSRKIRELMESGERYKYIVEDSSDIIFSLDARARILYMNRKGLQTLGLDVDQVKGMHCSSFISDEVSKRRLNEITEAMDEKDYHEPFDMAIETKEGRRIYRADLVKIGDRNRRETVCVARDISEEIVKEKRLKLLADIEHFSVDAIVGLDNSGRILSWNTGAQMMFGWEEDEIVGRGLSTLVPESGRAQVESMLREASERGTVREREGVWRTRSGGVLDVAVTMNALRDEAGEVFGISAIVMDRTEKKKMESALIQSERLAAMGRLAASIAHEINNPLYGIRSCLNHVLSAGRGEVDHQFVRLALKETDRIADLIRNMKTFYQPQEGGVADADLVGLLRDVFILNRKYIEENMVKLQFSPVGAVVVECIPEQVKQVFINILTNSVEAMPEGGELRVECRPVDEGRSAEVVFRDTGVGIASEDLPQIFDMFFSKKPSIKGVGLGLSVSYGIVKRHGGTIEVASEEGKGTVVTLRFPAHSPLSRQMQLELA